jgi:hypothetical protein
LLGVALPVFVFTESRSGRATAAVFVIEPRRQATCR